MSSSSADPVAVSVVIASNGTPGSVEACLAALESQAEGRAIVCERDGALVPELWQDGIDAATGDVVCLTISVMRPAADWLATARRLAGQAGAVGGAIEPGEDLRLRDWAEYFCRYARDMPPFAVRETADLPGDNAVYTRAALRRRTTSTATGSGSRRSTARCESTAAGCCTRRSSSCTRTFGWFGAFVRQRLVHGRKYGRQRGVRFSARNLAGIPAAVVVPAVLWHGRSAKSSAAAAQAAARGGDAAAARLRHRWAVGEAAGHLDSLRSR